MEVNKNKHIEAACFIVLVSGMILLAEFTGEKEIIFPEIAALGTGCFLTPELAWKTDYLRMLFCV